MGPAMLNRRQLLAAGLGATGAVASGAALAKQVWPLLAREDLIPGDATSIELPRRAWTETDNEVSFVALGDTGTDDHLLSRAGEAVGEAPALVTGATEDTDDQTGDVGEVPGGLRGGHGSTGIVLRSHGPTLLAGRWRDGGARTCVALPYG